MICNKLTPFELPVLFEQYCTLNNYALSNKKKALIAYILKLNQPTSIDTMLLDLKLSGIKASRSNIYLVLQWLMANNLVTKAITGHAQWILYMPDEAKINTIQMAYKATILPFSSKPMYNGLTVSSILAGAPFAKLELAG